MTGGADHVHHGDDLRPSGEEALHRGMKRPSTQSARCEPAQAAT